MSQKTVMGVQLIQGRVEFNGFVVARLNGSVPADVKWAFENWCNEAQRLMKGANK